MLELRSVGARYDPKIEVLRNISLSVPRGKTTCVLGSNGAGKTTLLRTIVGLVPFRRGTIHFDGEPIHDLGTHQIAARGIAVVPESRQLFPKLTIDETLRVGAYDVVDRTVFERRRDAIFELFPVLGARRQQLSGTLSGGELSMLSIARALMSEPKMILLDEPSLGLAPKAVSRVFQTIQEISERDITILVIEQNVRKSLAISSYGYVLQKGAVVEEGGADALRESNIVRHAYLLG